MEEKNPIVYDMLSEDIKLCGRFAGNNFAVMIGEEVAQNPKNISKLIEAFRNCGRRHEPNLSDEKLTKESLLRIGVYAAAYDYRLDDLLPIWTLSSEELECAYNREGNYGLAMKGLARHFECTGQDLFKKLFL